METLVEGAPAKVAIPYKPRKHFLPLHNSARRFQLVVAHRRAGKTVAEYNHLLKAALGNKRQHPPPRYAYVGPSFEQTKDLVWGYAKYYAGNIQGVDYSEGELTTKLPTGATIKLYGGAAAYERMRGLYFDGIILDEFPLLASNVFSSVVRPCLADYRGFGIISGTSNGDDHFHALFKRYDGNPGWEQHIIPVTDTDVLSPEEIAEMTQDMSPEEYAREMLCSFEAPIEGSYYADVLNMLSEKQRITGVPYDSTAQVVTAWDLGIHDETCVWFFQICGREVHWINYISGSGKGLDHYARILKDLARSQGYQYRCHLLPHDVEARELGTGQSRRQVLNSLLDPDPIITVPLSNPDDGINAARGIMSTSWFDKKGTEKGLSCLRSYKRSKLGHPVHDWASHGADAFRTGATGFHLVTSFMGGPIGRLRRRIRGVI
jgi:hypothetical protein